MGHPFRNLNTLKSEHFHRWSGITEQALEGVTTTFEDVQSHLLAILSASPTPVLLGHSLESDLKALKICHPLCIDTAVIFHHPRGRPLKPGLAWLTKKWCGREIQNRGEGGHDPEEDARACIDLLKKKVQNGKYPPFACQQGLTDRRRSGIWRVQSRLRIYFRAPLTSTKRWRLIRRCRPWKPGQLAWQQSYFHHCVQDRRGSLGRSSWRGTSSYICIRTFHWTSRRLRL